MQPVKRAWTIGRLALIVPILVAGLAVAGVRSAVAAPVSCTTTISNTTVKGPVDVPAGASCTLSGVIVQGGVTVNAGAVLNITRSQNLTEIRGNVVANSALFTGLYSGVTVRGNVTASGASNFSIDGATIRGNATVSGTTGGFFVSNATITGSLVISGNTTFSGATVSNNTIKINLICDNNTPAPVASNNVVGNANIGQCAEGGGGDG